MARIKLIDGMRRRVIETKLSKNLYQTDSIVEKIVKARIDAMFENKRKWDVEPVKDE